MNVPPNTPIHVFRVEYLHEPCEQSKCHAFEAVCLAVGSREIFFQQMPITVKHRAVLHHDARPGLTDVFIDRVELVWCDQPDLPVDLNTLSFPSILDHLRLVKSRGHRDWIRIKWHMRRLRHRSSVGE